MDPTADERFTRIYEAYYPDVLAYCARRVDRSDAEDVANEVFTTLWRRIGSFDPDEPLPWLYRVALGAVRNRQRSRKRLMALRTKLDGSWQSEPSAEVYVVKSDADRVVLDALAELKSGDQEVLRLSVWEELTAREIGLIVGCSVSAAEQRLWRAKQRLAKSLSRVSPGYTPSHPSPENGGLT